MDFNKTQQLRNSKIMEDVDYLKFTNMIKEIDYCRENVDYWKFESFLDLIFHLDRTNYISNKDEATELGTQYGELSNMGVFNLHDEPEEALNKIESFVVEAVCLTKLRRAQK